METITIENDITIMYVTANSFPGGVQEAHEQLHKQVLFSTGRKYFGVSRPENGAIIYRAGTEIVQAGEAERYHFETMVLKKGKYIAATLVDFMKDIPSIGKTFQQLLSHPGIDPQGYCVEWYTSNKDMQCMVRLAE